MDREESSSSEKTRRKGPYGKHLIIGSFEPRTTKWRRKHTVTDTDMTDDDVECEHGQNEDDDLNAGDGHDGDASSNLSALLDLGLDTPGGPTGTLGLGLLSDVVEMLDREGEETEEFDEIPETDHPHDKGDEVLYSGSRLTVATSMLLIVTFCIRHGLSGNALCDLLTLVELHCMVDNACRSTISLYRKFFLNSRTPMKFEYYCKNCFHHLGGGAAPTSCSKCKSENVGYFVRIPLADQLNSILSRDGMMENLNYRNIREKKDGCIEDIFDGLLYKQHFDDDGFLNGQRPRHPENEVHISLQLNSDGVAIFKSSKFSIWPIYGTINELPPELRYRRDNRIFLGLWYGVAKPSMRIFLHPFVQELNDFQQNGILLKQGTLLKGIVLSTVADAPARCMMMDFTQYNGKFGCPCCYSEGQSQRVGGGYSRIYPFDLQEELGHAKTRTLDETVETAKRVQSNFLSSNKSKPDPENGIRGYSPLLSLKKFDMVKGTAIDYMHCITLGVAKRLFHLWFDSVYSRCGFSVRKHISEINTKVKFLKPPNLISRLPRSIDDMAHWKASEYRSFLLFYSLPVLSGYLPDEYMQHYTLLVSSVFILLQTSISMADLAKARIMLKQFCLNFPEYYGVEHQTFNLHCLLHICDKVELLGPLWAHSCFFYESLNGDLRKLFHGSQSVDMQIIFAVCTQQRIPELELQLTFGTSAASFYNKMTNHHHLTDNRVEIGDHWWALGPFYCVQNMDEQLRSVVEKRVGHVYDIEYFLRVQNGRVVFHSQEYKRVSRRISYCVQYNKKYYSLVLRYLRCKVFSGFRYLAVVVPLSITDNGTIPTLPHCTVPHLIPVSCEVGRKMVLDVNAISGMCMYLEGVTKTGQDFVARLPNNIESD